MSLASGTEIGPYEILSLLGAGGMGEVYRARDTKLGRDVALKVLPAAMAHDAERMARFQREAQVLASLNHPNIAAIYGLEDSADLRALVMELVEGPTLAERIVRTQPLTRPASGASPSPQGRGAGGEGSPLPLEETLSVAKQIAHALEYAHERGIVHRDLKPANVKVTSEGVVKVLDFGLAKAFEVGEASALPREPRGLPYDNSPTISRMATQAGIILGTAAYMSPEQAKGKAVDRRADIWAFGCVLYELLSGKKAFDGETTTDVLAAVVMKEPDWGPLPAETPAAIRHLLRRCLQKDAKQRLRDIGEARIAIEETISGEAVAPGGTCPDAIGSPAGAPTDEGATRGATWRRALPWAIAGLLLAALVAEVLLRVERPQAPARRVTRLSIPLPPNPSDTSDYVPQLALSPDGNQLAYSEAANGRSQLYLRSLDQFEAKPIAGTEDAEAPFFSPDGQWLGFFAHNHLEKVALAGGPVQTLCGVGFIDAVGNGASWSPDGTIVFQGADGLSRVTDAGGDCQDLARPDFARGEQNLGWPQILPGGETLLFSVYRGLNFENSAISLLSLKTRQRQTLPLEGTNPQYLPQGYMVYAQAGSLLAVPFDLAHLKATGSPMPVLDGVLTDFNSGNALFTISRDGTLAYMTGGNALADAQVVEVSQGGKPQALTPSPGAYEDLALSPDGKRVAMTVMGPEWAIWIYDIRRSTLTRFTFENDNRDPCWTPDGKRVIYGSFRKGTYGLYWKAADGSGPEEPLLTSKDWVFATSVTPDGKELAYTDLSPETGADLWILPLEGDRKPRPFLRTRFNEWIAQFSPDGRWIAYESNESGRSEIYVRQYPGPGGQWQISNEGGTRPVWSRDGRQIFYRNGDKLMAVPIETKPAFSAGTPSLLFQGTYFVTGHYYDVMPDGKHFIFIKEAGQAGKVSQINVVLNWVDELTQRMSAGAKR